MRLSQPVLNGFFLSDNEFLFVGGDRVGHGFYRKHGLRGREGDDFYSRDGLRDSGIEVFTEKIEVRVGGNRTRMKRIGRIDADFLTQPVQNGFPKPVDEFLFVGGDCIVFPGTKFAQE